MGLLIRDLQSGLVLILVLFGRLHWIIAFSHWRGILLLNSLQINCECRLQDWTEGNGARHGQGEVRDIMNSRWTKQWTGTFWQGGILGGEWSLLSLAEEELRQWWKKLDFFFFHVLALVHSYCFFLHISDKRGAFRTVLCEKRGKRKEKKNHKLRLLNVYLIISLSRSIRKQLYKTH